MAVFHQIHFWWSIMTSRSLNSAPFNSLTECCFFNVLLCTKHFTFIVFVTISITQGFHPSSARYYNVMQQYEVVLWTATYYSLTVLCIPYAIAVPIQRLMQWQVVYRYSTSLNRLWSSFLLHIKLRSQVGYIRQGYVYRTTRLRYKEATISLQHTLQHYEESKTLTCQFFVASSQPRIVVVSYLWPQLKKLFLTTLQRA